jgi:glycosyl transferase family 4/glycosyl transferase family 1
MKVLYLTYDGLTDSLGQSQVLPYIVGLSAHKIDFTIISFEKKEAFYTQKDIINTIVKANNIKWTPLKYTKTPPFLSTLYDIYKFKKSVKKNILESKISLIHCRSYISALVGLWAKKKYGVPFIFDMRGFWADERIDGNIWSLNNYIHKKAYQYFKNKEKEFLCETDYTISLTYKGQQEINSWELKNLSPIEVIPCCTDEKLFNLKNKSNFRQELNINNDTFVLLYLGSIGTWYLIDEMLDFFQQLLSVKADAMFLFITKDDPDFIFKKASEKKISLNKIIIKPSDRSDIPNYINTCNASIFFIKPTYSKKASSPTKMGELMNLGIPIICNSGVGDVDIMMNKTMPQLLVNKFDKNEYQKVINEIVSNYQLINKNKIITTSENYFSLHKGIDSYFNVYQSILNINK